REARQPPSELVASQHLVIRQGFAERQEIVERHADANLPARPARAAINREIEPQRLDEMRRDVEQRLPLAQRLAHETELAVLEIAQAAVDQPRRGRRRSARDVVLLDDEHREAGARRQPRDAGAVDAGADDGDVDRCRNDGVRSLFRGERRPAPSLRYGRVWPLPRTTYLKLVSSSAPTGPRAWMRPVAMPISAPMPNSPPSAN